MLNRPNTFIRGDQNFLQSQFNHQGRQYGECVHDLPFRIYNLAKLAIELPELIHIALDEGVS